MRFHAEQVKSLSRIDTHRTAPDTDRTLALGGFHALAFGPMRILSGTRHRNRRKPLVHPHVAPCGSKREHAPVPSRKLSTTNYPTEARVRLGEAVREARNAAGYMFRTTFARDAGIRSIRSLELLEAGDPGVGEAILFKVARALPNWTGDTPRLILEGGSAPSTEPELPPEPTDINDQMLASLREMRDFLDLYKIGGGEAAEFMDRLAQTWRQQEKDLGRYTRTLRIFTDETERDTPVADRKRSTPNE